MTRGPAKQFDPDVALDKAMHLFWEKGYASAGLTELLETMGISRKSLYDTFGNKRALYIAALYLYSQTIVAALTRELNNPNKPALDNVRTVMNALAAEHSEPMSEGCLLGVSMAQFRTDDVEMAKVLRRHMELVEGAYHTAFARAQADGDLKPETDIRNLAQLFMGAHQGLALIGRVTETSSVPQGIADGALAVLETA